MTEKKAVFDFKGWIREHHNTPYEIRLENDDLIKLVTEYGEASIQFTVIEEYTIVEFSIVSIRIILLNSIFILNSMMKIMQSNYMMRWLKH